MGSLDDSSTTSDDTGSTIPATSDSSTSTDDKPADTTSGDDAKIDTINKNFKISLEERNLEYYGKLYIGSKSIENKVIFDTVSKFTTISL